MAEDKKPETLTLKKTESAPVSHQDADIKRQVAATHANTDYEQLYGRELSDDEFKRRMESGGLMIDSVMPEPPRIDGYDTMWGTTMADSAGQLRWMLANGYTFVTREDAPHYRNHSPRGGVPDGVIGYNELVALKIKKGRREQIAKRFHHDMPLANEAAIRRDLSSLSDNAKHNVKIQMEDGMRDMGKRPASVPTFNL